MRGREIKKPVAKLPVYDERRGWHGGSKNVLYLVKDRRGGHERVRPIHMFKGVGPEVDVRVATRREAEAMWQSPLHAGWKTVEDFR